MNVYTSFLKGYEGMKLSTRQLIGVLTAMPTSATVSLRKASESDSSNDMVSITRMSQMGYRIRAGGSEHHALIDCGLNDRYVLFVGVNEQFEQFVIDVNDYVFLEYNEDTNKSCEEAAILLRGIARDLSDVFYDIRDRVVELERVCVRDDVSKFCIETLSAMRKGIEGAYALAAECEKE